MIFDNPYILCSAIHIETGEEHVHSPRNIKTGFVVSGRRHHNCFATIMNLVPECREKYRRKDMIQGFITSDDRFLTREESLYVAIECGQVDPDNMICGTLTSEDLWQ